MPQRQWHALVIGVDRYPAFPQKQLSGCVNDANAVRRFLVERVQVPEANIRCLTSPREPAVPDVATTATAANIRAAFAALIGRVQPADHVVLYYAGHGLKLSIDAGDGAKRSYYGFAPEDTAKDAAGYANLILGAEVHVLLKTIEEKGATATVIADTCHSGSSTRAVDDDVRERVLRVEPLSEDQGRDFIARHPALQPSAASRGLATSSSVAPFGSYPGGDYVMLTGCLDSETSKEDFAVIVGDQGTPTRVTHGLLTLALLKELEGVTPDAVRSLRWIDFYERLRGNVAQRTIQIKSSSQTVSLEGRREKTVFGGEWRPFAPGFTVRTINDGTLIVDGGALHGLEPGAVLAIHPPDVSDFNDTATPGVEAMIEKATPMTSTARLKDATVVVADLSRARLVRPGPATAPIVVRINASESMPAGLRDAIVRDAGDARSFTIVDDVPGVITPAHAELRRSKTAHNGWVLVRTDRFGAPSVETSVEPAPDDIVAYLPGASEETQGAALAQGLSIYGRYLQKRDRQAVDTSLASMLKVTLRAGVGEEPRPADVNRVAPLEPVAGAYPLTDAHWIWAEIRVLRATSLRLQIGWVMFSDDGNVVPLWPPEGSQPTFSKDAVVFVGYDRDGALSLTKRADQRTSMYTLAVIASTGPVDAPPLNIAALAQRSVQAEVDEVIKRAQGLQERGEPLRRAAPGEQPAWYAWNLRIAINGQDT